MTTDAYKKAYNDVQAILSKKTIDDLMEAAHLCSHGATYERGQYYWYRPGWLTFVYYEAVDGSNTPDGQPNRHGGNKTKKWADPMQKGLANAERIYQKHADDKRYVYADDKWNACQAKLDELATNWKKVGVLVQLCSSCWKTRPQQFCIMHLPLLGRPRKR